MLLILLNGKLFKNLLYRIIYKQKRQAQLKFSEEYTKLRRVRVMVCTLARPRSN